MSGPWPLAAVLGTFLLVLVLGRRMQLGYAICLGAVVLALLFRMPPAAFARSIGTALVERRTIELVASIFLVLILSEALKAAGQLEGIVKSSIRIFHDLRLVTMLMPSIVGMLPMPGGACVSAPMVDRALADTAVSPLRRLFANYWFRHTWEYIMPLYPGLVAAVALSGLDFGPVVRVNLLLSLAAIIIGSFFVFWLGRGDFHRRRHPYRGDRRQVRLLLQGVFPIALVLALAIFFNLPIAAALVVGITAFMISARFRFRQVRQVIAAALSLRMLALLLGISFFAGVLGDSGAVEGIAAFLEGSGIGRGPIIFGICFLSGLVTGIAIGFVGLSFPIVLPLLPETTPWSLMFVYAAGFGGVLLSPLHLCLVITCQHFGVKLADVYRYLLPATVAVMATGTIGWLISAG